MPCRTTPGSSAPARRRNQRNPRSMAHPARESSARPMASASAKKPPVRSASVRLPSVSVPATAPVPNRIATRTRYAGAIPRRRALLFASTSRRKISAGRMSRIPSNGGSVNSSVTRHATAIPCTAGHTSYMLANQFSAEGFALDLSADALRHGVVLMDRWRLSRAPIRVAGDAVNLPFRDGSIQFVMACQMLSQFMNIESVFLEVKRVLAPGGVFLFTEEPLRRLLSLRLYRAPYQDRMKSWERKLFEWGLLGYLARDVIGAEQEESFGIRQNHKMYLGDRRRLIAKHFARSEER